MPTFAGGALHLQSVCATQHRTGPRDHIASTAVAHTDRHKHAAYVCMCKYASWTVPGQHTLSPGQILVGSAICGLTCVTLTRGDTQTLAAIDDMVSPVLAMYSNPLQDVYSPPLGGHRQADIHTHTHTHAVEASSTEQMQPVSAVGTNQFHTQAGAAVQVGPGLQCSLNPSVLGVVHPQHCLVSAAGLTCWVDTGGLLPDGVPDAHIDQITLVARLASSCSRTNATAAAGDQCGCTYGCDAWTTPLPVASAVAFYTTSLQCSPLS